MNSIDNCKLLTTIKLQIAFEFKYVNFVYLNYKCNITFYPIEKG